MYWEGHKWKYLYNLHVEKWRTIKNKLQHCKMLDIVALANYIIVVTLSRLQIKSQIISGNQKSCRFIWGHKWSKNDHNSHLESSKNAKLFWCLFSFYCFDVCFHYSICFHFICLDVCLRFADRHFWVVYAKNQRRIKFHPYCG